MRKKTQTSLNCAITLCWGDLHRVLPNCQNKLARLGALSQQCIKLHALNVSFFFRSFFLELSDIIWSHHNDTLLHKSFISWWLRFVKISHSRKISVFSLSSKAEQGLPDVLTRAPPSSSPSCLTKLFWKIFSWTEVKLPHPPRWSEVQRRPLLQIQMGGLHQRPLRQGDLSS